MKIQDALYRCHKVSYGVQISLRTLFSAIWLSVLLILCIRKILCDVYIHCLMHLHNVFKMLCIDVIWCPLELKNSIQYYLVTVLLLLCIRETFCDEYIICKESDYDGILNNYHGTGQLHITLLMTRQSVG